MLERGEVVALEGGQARVRFRRSSACGNCQACGMLKDMSEIEIKLDNILHAEAGDLVTVEMSSRNLLKSSAIAYVFPLIFLIIGLILGYYISSIFSLNGELCAALGGIALTTVAFLVVRIAEPRLKKRLTVAFRMVAVEKVKGV